MEAAVVHEEEEDEEVDEARRRGGERGRTRTMRRRYATEYHYPDNGPAISSNGVHKSSRERTGYPVFK